MKNKKALLQEFVKLILSEGFGIEQFAVGDEIVPTDGSDYHGKITYISKDEDVVKHVDTRTGKEWKKSYSGFAVRYRKKS